MKEMGRPKGGTNKTHSKEEKLALVLRNLAGETLMSLERETGISNSLICKWTKQYLAGGEEALINKRNPGNPLSKYTRKKVLTYTEQLEYENALLKRELLKKDAEVVRLKSRKFWKAETLKSVIDQAIYYYNYIKPIRKLKGKPPVQFRIEQAA